MVQRYKSETAVGSMAQMPAENLVHAHGLLQEEELMDDEVHVSSAWVFNVVGLHVAADTAV